MRITREWAMPSPDTFSIPPISELLDRWLPKQGVIVDPFARNSKRANKTNDLNPDTSAEFHLEAADFLEKLQEQGVTAQAILIDPPYSPRQISEVYKRVGLPCGMEETQNARLYRNVKLAANQIAGPGCIVICCGWNSAGMGDRYSMEEILLVAHGGAHNDTIVTVNRKMQGSLFAKPRGT